MEKEIFRQLIKRCQEGTATAEEHRLVDAYYNRLEEEGGARLAPATEEALRERMLHNINSAVQEEGQEIPVIVTRSRQWWQYAAAAAVLGIMIAAGGYYFTQRPVVHKDISSVTPHEGHIPGYNKATLTLANGVVVPLDSTGHQVIQQGNVTVYQQKGLLEYKEKGRGDVIAFNKLKTPRGAQYRLTLPDGTGVWLNAASELKYPTSFQDKERRVYLSGEGYFEIAANAQQPFVVSANGVDVNVLGTQFNIMAYTDEAFVKTTLLQGAVRVSKEQETVILQPGQAAILNNARKDIQVQQTNTAEDVAWKNGYFVFNNENLESIMKKIVRYYDVEVEYRTDISNKNFGGSVARFGSLTELLSTLELTGIVHFKIDGNKVIVMP